MSPTITPFLAISVALALVTAAHARDDLTPLERLAGVRTLDVDATNETSRERRAADLLRARGIPALPNLAWLSLESAERENIAREMAVENARGDQLRQLWIASSEPSDPAQLPRVRAEFLERLEAVLALHDLPPDDIRRTRDVLATLAREAPALWTTNWRDVDAAFDPNAARLENRLDLMADLAGRTLRLARAAHARGDSATARASALDGLRVIAEAYLLAGATEGDRIEQCDRTGVYGIILGASASAASIFGIGASAGSPALLGAAVVATTLSVGTTCVGFVNSNLEFKEGRKPWLMPKKLKEYYQRKSAEQALRRFWLAVATDVQTYDELSETLLERGPLGRLTVGYETRVRDWVMTEIHKLLGDEGSRQFCAKILGQAP